MPEIAEVRTVARTLNKRITGRKISDIDFIYDKIIEGNKDEFKELLIGNVLKSVDNYGKWLIFNFGEYTLLSHLRMEGKFFIKDCRDEIQKHEHIIFHLDDGTDLRYHDTRKFGRMLVVRSSLVYETKELKKLGYEPDSNLLTSDYLYQILHNKNKPIKTLLLDQTIINGLGNIYVDEVLFASNIHPLTKGCLLTIEDCERIKNSAAKIISKATDMGGTTIRSYTSSLNVYGTYQSELKVHTKVNEPCPVCNSPITKIQVGGRGTYFCSQCQKEK